MSHRSSPDAPWRADKEIVAQLAGFVTLLGSMPVARALDTNRLTLHNYLSGCARRGSVMVIEASYRQAARATLLRLANERRFSNLGAPPGADLDGVINAPTPHAAPTTTMRVRRATTKA